MTKLKDIEAIEESREWDKTMLACAAALAVSHLITFNLPFISSLF